MNLNELDACVREKEPNICQICVRKDGEEIYSREWNGYKKTDTAHIMSATKSVFSLLTGIAEDLGMIRSTEEKVLSFFPLKRASSSFCRKSLERDMIERIRNRAAPVFCDSRFSVIRFLSSSRISGLGGRWVWQ